MDQNTTVLKISGETYVEHGSSVSYEHLAYHMVDFQVNKVVASMGTDTDIHQLPPWCVQG